MTFDGEAFVDEMRADLQGSGRTLDQADWVKRTEQGEATKEDLVAWARQHYHGVTYHTRRVLSAWVTRVPYEMTDGIIDNLAEEVLGTTSKSGFGHLHWLFEFTRALGARDRRRDRRVLRRQAGNRHDPGQKDYGNADRN